ncbi:MAG: transposase [Chloroflexota bacterium]
MSWYNRVLDSIKAAVPFLNVSQTINLALLVSAILDRRTFNLSELARAYPTPEERRVEDPKHDLLHRLKRLWRFLGNERVDDVAVQAALIPHTLARLGNPRWLGLAIDWTMFDTVMPSGQRVRYQVLRIAIPRRGRALPLFQVAYDRDSLPAPKSQNRLEEEALLAVIRALPKGVRPVILGDRGFARANFFAFLKAHGLDYVIRIDKGTCMTEADGRRWKLGEEGTKRGEIRWSPLVRYALHHGRPTDLLVNVALCWRLPPHQARNPRHKEPKEPWYLASSLGNAGSAVAWYQQRGWIEQSFKDSKSRFGLAAVQVSVPERLTRLLVALTIALTWLTLAALPEVGALPKGWHAAVAQRGRVSLISLALALLDHLDNLPPACLPSSSFRGGYA